MRTVPLVLALSLSSSVTWAADDACLAAAFGKHANTGTNIGWKEFQALHKDPEYRRCIDSRREAKVIPSKAVAPSSPLTKGSPQPESEDRPLTSTKVYSLLRRDFTDVLIFTNPAAALPVAEAEGAQLAISGDRIANNTAWSVNGMAAVVLQHISNRFPEPGEPGPHLIGVSVAPYAKVERVSNSNPKAQKNNLDTLTTGGFTEIGLDMLGGQHYFRLKGALVEDRISDKTTAAAVFEWIPIYSSLKIGTPTSLFGMPIVYRLNPELKVRYDSLVLDAVKNEREYLLRAGPQLVAVYKFAEDGLPEVLKRVHGKTAYSWLTSSNGDYSLFETSVTYNIDAEGHVGLTGSYSNGEVEATASKVDIWKLSFTVKW